METKWLAWAQRIQSISQAGIEYSKDPYDIERFEQLRILSSEIVSEYTGLEMDKVKDLFANETGYQTPKVDVRAVILEKGRLLLVEENDGKWSLPGGWAEPHLSVKENVIKEVIEEAGAKVEPEEIIAVLDRNRHAKDDYPYSVYKIFVCCRYLGGKFQENIETGNALFFGRQDLPEISESRTTRQQIEMCFNYADERNTRVLFD